MTYQCLICLNDCKHPAILMLNCQCQYYVHYRCYKKWWKENQNCIICLTEAEEPYSYNSFNSKNSYKELLLFNHKNLNDKIDYLDNYIIFKNKKMHGFIISSIFISFFYFKIPLGASIILSFFYFFFILLP